MREGKHRVKDNSQESDLNNWLVTFRRIQELNRSRFGMKTMSSLLNLMSLSWLWKLQIEIVSK